MIAKVRNLTGRFDWFWEAGPNGPSFESVY